ncbi:hypothetical protein BFJ63_vAg13757 [Fusarium oxysporum f. sp. narcissi]|uniref:Uncharacterized protein n=1 Tax=Fusarium oxysporum f. sp. narcissi TaxID=451672 RepID=A0A4Q2V8N4_FUSOX|nr:hypothetical protein BFJ70_g6703 [Fusarium oxysporum]RYC83354.1 hypothetical protein BFJ63_vAg13757 [Fusarium oxysporum f. sp. narcissi]
MISKLTCLKTLFLSKVLLYSQLDALLLLPFVWTSVQPQWHWSISMALNLPAGTLETSRRCSVAFDVPDFACPTACGFPRPRHCWPPGLNEQGTPLHCLCN